MWRNGWRLDVGPAQLLKAMSLHGEHRFCTADPDNPDEFNLNPVAGSRKALNLHAIQMLPSFRGMSVSTPDLDADPCLLGGQGGLVLDLREGAWRPVTHEDRLLQRLPVRPQPWKGRFIDRFMQAVFEDQDMELLALHRAIGSMLWGAPMLRILLFLPGVTGAGKTLLLELLKRALGPHYATTVDAADFVARVRGFDKHNANALLRTARIATLSEVGDDQVLDPAKLNQVSGGDTLVSRRIGADMVTTQAQHSLVMAMNTPAEGLRQRPLQHSPRSSTAPE